MNAGPQFGLYLSDSQKTNFSVEHMPATDNNRVRKIYEDHDGDVWICTDHGINFYDRNSRQMRNFIVYDKSGKATRVAIKHEGKNVVRIAKKSGEEIK